jgi:hypothetical protein
MVLIDRVSCLSGTAKVYIGKFLRVSYGSPTTDTILFSTHTHTCHHWHREVSEKHRSVLQEVTQSGERSLMDKKHSPNYTTREYLVHVQCASPAEAPASAQTWDVCTEACSQPLLFELELAGNWCRNTNPTKDLHQFSSTIFHNIE